MEITYNLSRGNHDQGGVLGGVQEALDADVTQG